MYILDKFVYNNTIYYRDPYGLILSSDNQIVGIYKTINEEYFYYFIYNDD